MNWVYRLIQINKRVAWIIPVLFLLLWFPIAIASLLILGTILLIIDSNYNLNLDFINIYVRGLFFLLLLGFIALSIYYIIFMLPIRLIWSKAKSNLLFGNWYNHKNIIGKDIYHLMEFYNKEDNVVHDINNNFILRFKDNILKFRNNVMRLESISCVVEEFLNEKQVKYQKEKRFLGYPGYLRRGYKRRYYHLVFPLLCKLFPTSIRDFSNYRRRFPDGITFQLPDNKLYILVGVEGVGNPLIPAIFFLTHPAAYIQICGICDENRLFVEELELKITGKLKQNPNIKFLTPESTKYDIN